MLHEALTREIIQAYYKVYNTLGYGFLEKVYQNAMAAELIKHGMIIETQSRIDVYYEDRKVGEYFADMVVNDLVILELKAAECLREDHLAQLINYLRATRVEVGLLMNFGRQPQFKRAIFTNDRKRVGSATAYGSGDDAGGAYPYRVREEPAVYIDGSGDENRSGKE